MTTAGQDHGGAEVDWSSRDAKRFCATLLAMAAHDLRQPLQALVGLHCWLDHASRATPSGRISAAADWLITEYEDRTLAFVIGGDDPWH